jgi:SAM-dependent methyltransferase
VPRGATYDARFERLEAAGVHVHGEADLVASLLVDGRGTVLDAGCGTGRVAIELARRGVSVVGVDRDPAMLETARTKAPELRWVPGDLADPELDVGQRFDVVVAAGNVMIFLAPGTEPAAVATMARHLVDGGLLVAGFQLGQLSLSSYDESCAANGLTLVQRWATWDRAPFTVSGADYAVSVHRS